MIATQFAVCTARCAMRACWGVVLVVSASTALAQAPVFPDIVNSLGFEAPAFDTTFGPGGPGTGTGQLEGQTPSTFNGTWLRTKGPGLSTADVQNSVFKSGSQAVKVTKAPNSDDRWGVLVGGYPAGDYICISWDMRVEQTVGPPDSFGPFFGMEAYDTDSASIGLLGSLGVDATTGDVLYQQQTTGFLAETGAVVQFGAWNHFMVQLDYVNKQYSYFLNFALLGVEGFVDEFNVVGGLNEFTDANISALAAAGDPASQALTGIAYFDNFVVVEGICIPEPASAAMGMLALTGLAALRRGRRSAG